MRGHSRFLSAFTLRLSIVFTIVTDMNNSYKFNSSALGRTTITEELYLSNHDSLDDQNVQQQNIDKPYKTLTKQKPFDTQIRNCWVAPRDSAGHPAHLTYRRCCAAAVWSAEPTSGWPTDT